MTNMAVSTMLIRDFQYQLKKQLNKKITTRAMSEILEAFEEDSSDHIEIATAALSAAVNNLSSFNKC